MERDFLDDIASVTEKYGISAVMEKEKIKELDKEEEIEIKKIKDLYNQKRNKIRMHYSQEREKMSNGDIKISKVLINSNTKFR